MKKFGLIGYPLTHSFSKKYFSDKFHKEGLENCQYDLYEIPEIEHLPTILAGNPELQGLNVTIPYKQLVIPFLDRLEANCKAIGAVNTIKIRNGHLTGYNTDYIGFKTSLQNWIQVSNQRALVLGTGGASRAVIQALKELKIDYLVVSRKRQDENKIISYRDLYEKPVLANYHLIINTTPLGTYPDTEVMPDIPLDLINENHKVYDLVYNPEKTFLMRSLEARGALIKNGLEMLHLQAEAAWQIWNE